MLRFVRSPGGLLLRFCQQSRGFAAEGFQESRGLPLRFVSNPGDLLLRFVRINGDWSFSDSDGKIILKNLPLPLKAAWLLLLS
jgi:hypothetical protein